MLLVRVARNCVALQATTLGAIPGCGVGARQYAGGLQLLQRLGHSGT
ncbi:hypothetical protein SFR_3257 [Streptomyces sp. FR-008]|nr:hypothetical protein SFR_3257 [Streptomyces sp. FR-008]